MSVFHKEGVASASWRTGSSQNLPATDLKLGIMTKGIADRKRLGSCLEIWKEVQREMGIPDREPPS